MPSAFFEVSLIDDTYCLQHNVDVERAKRVNHVITRCPMTAVMIVLLATLSVIAVVVTLKSLTYRPNTSIKVSTLNIICVLTLFAVKFTLTATSNKKHSCR